jgi:hypothetical protein
MTSECFAAAALLLLASAGASAADSYPLTLTRGSRLMIGASINDHPVDALLDSAAEATLLDRAFAATLHLKSSSSTVGQGSGSATFEAGLVSGVRLSALGLSLPDQTVAIVDLSDVARRLLGRHLDVVLGREIFDAARLWIDIDARRIRVLTPDQQPAGVRLALLTEKGIETLPVRVEGEPVSAAFDLGNGGQVLVGLHLAQRMHWLTDGRSIHHASGGGLGGETTRQIITLKSLEVAGQVFANVTASIDAQPSASDLNIGVKVLRHFLITTDFAHHAVWLQPRR